MGILANAAAERAVLSGVIKYGEQAYLDVVDMINPATFTIDSNKAIWKCLDHIFKVGEVKDVDVPTILSAAYEIGLRNHFDKAEEAKHLAGISAMPVAFNNVRVFAATCRKLQIARLVREQLAEAQENLLEVTGEESILSILSLAEIDFSSLMADGENGPRKIGDGIMEYMLYLADNPVEQIGLSTGFPAYDEAIGGGLRPSTINVIAARPKVGKTLLSDNMGYAIAKRGIPVLNMDTEMTEEDHYHRLTAMVSGVSIRDIETGKYGKNPELKEKVLEACKEIKQAPYFYKSIAGKSFEDQLSIMRRWLSKEVGLNADGTAKECVIVYDYLKLMDAQGISADMKEYQLLGFMMTTMHNFAHRYGVPFLAFMQLNRDGIEKEDTSAASGSDRIIWLCSNFSILKLKSDEEVQQDGYKNGNRKLKPIVCRHGAGMEFGDYINCVMTGHNARIVEGKTKLELESELQNANEGYVDETDDGADIPFENTVVWTGEAESD